MSFASPVPAHPPVIPQPVMKSLQSWNFEGLTEQRDRARSLCQHVRAMQNIYDNLHREGFENYEEYHAAFQTALNDPASPLSGLPESQKQDLIVTPDKISQMLAQTDHTTLSPQSAEDREFMERVFKETMEPLPMKALCAYPEKIELILDLAAANPERRIACVTGFPHSAFSPDDAKKQIKAVHDMISKKGLKNPVDIDSVAHYLAWMEGDHDLVKAIFDAEAKACAKAGFTWKTILKSSVHAYAAKNKTYGGDYFKSIYDMGKMALESGAKAGLENHFLKTCTGQAAAAPFNNFVPVDTAYPESMIAMFMANADFNDETGLTRSAKVSGGNKNEKDAVGTRYLYKYCGGKDPLNTDHLVMGAGILYRPQLLRFLYAMEQKGGPSCGFGPESLTPYGLNITAQNSDANKAKTGAKTSRNLTP